MKSEEWKLVPDEEFEGKYQVSNRGRVWRNEYSIDIDDALGRSYTRTYKGQMVTQHDLNGYRIVNLSTGHRSHSTRYVHRLVLRAFRGEPPTDEHQANHLGGDKSNNSLQNLEWVTCQENITHAVENGLQNTGFHETKIPAEDIPVLRERKETEDVTHQELADEYGVGALYMCALLTGNTQRAVA